MVQEFSFANCETKANINRIFNSHFTGSVLWNLTSKEADMVYNTWNVSIRKMFRLDRTTHRYLIEPISRIQHIKISIMKRLAKFTDKLSTTNKQTVRNVYHSMVNDCRSTIGTNSRFVRLECNKSKVLAKDIEKKSFCAISQCEKWRTSVIEDLINIRDNYSNPIGWNKEDIIDALHHVCTS